MLDEMFYFREKKFFCDVTLVAGDKEIEVINTLLSTTTFSLPTNPYNHPFGIPSIDQDLCQPGNTHLTTTTPRAPLPSLPVLPLPLPMHPLSVRLPPIPGLPLSVRLPPLPGLRRSVRLRPPPRAGLPLCSLSLPLPSPSLKYIMFIVDEVTGHYRAGH